MGDRPPGRHRRRRAHAARRHVPQRRLFRLRRRAAPHQFPRAGRQGRDHLRPAGGGEGPGRRGGWPTAGRSCSRPRTSACTTSPATTPKIRFHHEGRDQELDLRFHRRLRRLPRHLPAEHSGERAHRLRPRISVRLGRHPLGIAAARGRADLCLSRARLCALHHALADPGAALFPMRARRGDRELAGRAHLAGAARPHRRDPAAGGGHHAAEGHHRHAQLRGRADAIWPHVPRRRFRPHPAADRREGHEPRFRRRDGALARARPNSIAPAAATCSSDIRRSACGGPGRRSASPGG